ncbi:hypothetical protein [Pseudaestuariivita sp.]|uniref:hypothetical protein n=1 Tax=Pseudaestuariivita sp. TaxID=2211669 RepID=UPI004058AEE0
MSAPVATFRPARRAYAKRLALLFAFTIAVLIPGWAYFGVWQSLAGSVLLALCYMFATDELSLWRRHAQAVWTLTDQTLTYANPVEEAEAHSLPLTEIAQTKVRLGTHVVLRLTNGTAITMAYLSDPKGAKASIDAARAGASGNKITG